MSRWIWRVERRKQVKAHLVALTGNIGIKFSNILGGGSDNGLAWRVLGNGKKNGRGSVADR